MQYPLDAPVVEKIPPQPVFKKGRWYRCIESDGYCFTVGKAYLCCVRAAANRYAEEGNEVCLVDNYGNTMHTRNLLSRFEEITQ